MSDPIVDKIAQDLEARINEITTENGFSENLIALRPKRLDFENVTPTDKTVLIEQADETKPEEQPYSAIEWIQPFILWALVISSDKSTESINKRINRVRADIQKKLREDVTRGGNAIDTILLPSAIFDDGEGFSGVAVAIAVQYRVNENDPYTKM